MLRTMRTQAAPHPTTLDDGFYVPPPGAVGYTQLSSPNAVL